MCLRKLCRPGGILRTNLLVMSVVSASNHSTASSLLQAEADTAVAHLAKQGREQNQPAPMLPATAADWPAAWRAQLRHLYNQLHLDCSTTGHCQSWALDVAPRCRSAAASIAAVGPADRRGQPTTNPQLLSPAAAYNRCFPLYQRLSCAGLGHVS